MEARTTDRAGAGHRLIDGSADARSIRERDDHQLGKGEAGRPSAGRITGLQDDPRKLNLQNPGFLADSEGTDRASDVDRKLSGPKLTGVGDRFQSRGILDRQRAPGRIHDPSVASTAPRPSGETSGWTISRSEPRGRVDRSTNRWEPQIGRSGVIVQKAERPRVSVVNWYSLPASRSSALGSPGHGHLEVDRIERASDHVVAQHGHPLRRVGMDRHLTLDRDADSRRESTPRQSRPVCERHRLDKSDDVAVGSSPPAPEDSEEIKVKPGDP